MLIRKIITLAASLQEDTIDLYKDHFYDSGSIYVEGSKIKCWKDGGHGAENFLNVVENSCNLGVNTGTYSSLLKSLQII